jgi:hypothetical protein
MKLENIKSLQIFHQGKLCFFWEKYNLKQEKGNQQLGDAEVFSF